MTFSITTICHCAECHDLFIVVLNVIMLSVVMLNVIVLSVAATARQLTLIIQLEQNWQTTYLSSKIVKLIVTFVS
jgi:hypothetical protein